MSQNSKSEIRTDEAARAEADSSGPSELVFDMEQGLTAEMRSSLAADGVDVDAGLRDLNYNFGLWIQRQSGDNDRDVIGSPATGYYHIPLNSCAMAITNLFGAAFGTGAIHQPTSPAALGAYLYLLNALLNTAHAAHRATMTQAAICKLIVGHGGQGLHRDALFEQIRQWKSVLPEQGITDTELAAQLKQLETWGAIVEIHSYLTISEKRVLVRLPSME